jgi:hypothetical protein
MVGLISAFVLPQFNTHPASTATAEAFSEATDAMEDFVREAVR